MISIFQFQRAPCARYLRKIGEWKGTCTISNKEDLSEIIRPGRAAWPDGHHREHLSQLSGFPGSVGTRVENQLLAYSQLDTARGIGLKELSFRDEACEEVVVPCGGFALQAHGAVCGGVSH